MNAAEFDHVVWCDLEIVVLKIHSGTPWDTRMVSTCSAPDPSRPVVNVYVCREDDAVFDNPATYREKIVRRGSYRGHNFGEPARLKLIDEENIALFHPDPGQIIWSLVVKYVLTTRAIQENVLHLKGAAVAYQGKAFLFLGRGGSGKTELIRTLGRHGAELVANTHLLVRGSWVRGIRSNVRTRQNGRDVYASVDAQPESAAHDRGLPIGGVFWVNHRTDGQAFVKTLPAGYAKANLRYFTESITNWEIKEDIADHFASDPFEFAEHVNRIEALLDDFCENHDVHYLNVDILGRDGIEPVTAAMDACLRR